MYGKSKSSLYYTMLIVCAPQTVSFILEKILAHRCSAKKFMHESYLVLDWGLLMFLA